VKAKDADAAVAAGWAAYQPGFKRPLRIALPQAPRDGWDERKAFQYETSPNERAVVSAYAWRAGDAWTVVIVDGTEPTFEKRGAPLGSLFRASGPRGMPRVVRRKKAHPLDEKRLATLKDFVAGGMKLLDTPGVGWLHRRRERRSGRGPRREGAGQARPDRSRHALHRGLEHEGPDDAAPGRAGGRGKMRWDQPVTELFRRSSSGTRPRRSRCR